jgi:hypothetical protein
MSSQALASARKRRSVPDPVVPPPGQGRPGVAPGQGMPPNQGLTIQQVIALVDKRLLTLETFMKDVQQNGSLNANTDPTSQTSQSITQSTTTMPEVPENIKELLEEYNSRFDIIADELASIKNMMLSLQSFTMDVNKKLMDERIHILSSEDTPNITISQHSESEPLLSLEQSS